MELGKSEEISKSLLRNSEEKNEENQTDEILIKEEDDQNTCPICIDILTVKKDSEVGILICGHSGCRSCLVDWQKIKDECPICRKTNVFEVLDSTEYQTNRIQSDVLITIADPNNFSA